VIPFKEVQALIQGEKKFDLSDILQKKKIVLPKNWGMTTGTANWNMKSKATTLVKRLSQANKLSEKVIAIEQYQSSFEKFCQGKVGSQEELTPEVVDNIKSFLHEVSFKFGVTAETLDNIMDHSL
jgi:hypothetical protein